MRTALVPALTLAGVLAAGPAHALDCAFGPLSSLPADGATDVPTNARVHVLLAEQPVEEAGLVLVGPDDLAVEVTTTVHEQGGQDLVTFTPAEPLAADTVYRVVFDEPWSDDPAAATYATFTTGASVDAEAPASPAVESVKRKRGQDMWGGFNYVQVRLDAPEEPVLVELALADASTGEDLGTVFAIPWELDGSTVEASAGQELCAFTADLEGVGRIDVDIAVIDAAGNRTVVEEEARVGACSSLASPVSFGGVVLAGLMGIVTRRRRRGEG